MANGHEKMVIISGILLSHKRNTFESVLMKWMNLKPIIQNKVNQKEKNKYLTLTHTHIWSLLAEQQWRRRHGTDRAHVDKERARRAERVAWKYMHCHM